MSIVSTVEKLVKDSEDIVAALEQDDALNEAERLADLYADIRPEPYAVPIERFAGLPILGESKVGS